jgi:hypothetical protein
MMPALPGPHLVFIHTHLAFAAFKARFNATDLPSRFWGKASNFLELFEFLLHCVATIILAYYEFYLDINL